MTRPASATAGVVARKQLKVYFFLPHARPVPVKSWPCTSWFGQWSTNPPSSATAGLPVPNRWRVTWRPPVSRTAWSGDPRRTKSHPGSGRMMGLLDVPHWRDVALVSSSSQKPLCGLDLNPVNRIFPGCVLGRDGLQSSCLRRIYLPGMLRSFAPSWR